MLRCICVLLSSFILVLLVDTYHAQAQAGGSCAYKGISQTSGFGPTTPGAQLFFPHEGTINAFVVMVQHEDDNYDNSFTTDLTTECPSAHSDPAGYDLPV